MLVANATRFACDLATAHRSVAGCDQCTWWQQPPLATTAVAASARRPPTTAWFMCINKPQAHLFTRHSQFIDLVMVAVKSARLHAPSLQPYVLYMHSDGQRFEDADPLASWLVAEGVRVVNERLSFAAHVPRVRWRMKTLTGICKLDIPRVAHSLADELTSRGLDRDRVLWTDADVLFAGDWSPPPGALLQSVPRARARGAAARARSGAVNMAAEGMAMAGWPTSATTREAHQDGSRGGGDPLRGFAFAAGTEVFSPTLNSGVIYANVSAFVTAWPSMLAFAIRRRFKFAVADQSWMQAFFGDHWVRLDDAVYNARPFTHPRRHDLGPIRGTRRVDGGLPRPPRIWHWHGYKHTDVRCWLRAMANGSWPERAWRPPRHCESRRGSCSYKPIRGSGCRYLGRITPSRCYLRTYTYLLEQHEQLLAMARATWSWNGSGSTAARPSASSTRRPRGRSGEPSAS